MNCLETEKIFDTLLLFDKDAIVREMYMTGEEDTGKGIDTIGINVRRHKELLHRLFELVETSGIGPFMSTSQLIDLIAAEPSFTKKECVYLGLYLASMHHDDTTNKGPSDTTTTDER